MHGVCPEAVSRPASLLPARVPSGSSLPQQIEPVPPGGRCTPHHAGPSAKCPVGRVSADRQGRDHSTWTLWPSVSRPRVAYQPPPLVSLSNLRPPFLPEVRKRQLSSQCSALPSFPGLPGFCVHWALGVAGEGWPREQSKFACMPVVVKLSPSHMAKASSASLLFGDAFYFKTLFI